MKTLALVLLIFMGCNPYEDAIQRYGFVQMCDGFGSAVAIGNGFYLTATHVLKDDTLIAIVTPYGKDSSARIVRSDGDITLVRTRFTDGSDVGYGTVVVGQEVSYLQIMPVDSSFQLHYMTARVTRVDAVSFWIDRPTLPGVSGGGCYSNGVLVGIVVESIAFQWQRVGGRVLYIPTYLRGGVR